MIFSSADMLLFRAYRNGMRLQYFLNNAKASERVRSYFYFQKRHFYFQKNATSGCREKDTIPYLLSATLYNAPLVFPCISFGESGLFNGLRGVTRESGIFFSRGPFFSDRHPYNLAPVSGVGLFS